MECSAHRFDGAVLQCGPRDAVDRQLYGRVLLGLRCVGRIPGLPVHHGGAAVVVGEDRVDAPAHHAAADDHVERHLHIERGARSPWGHSERGLQFGVGADKSSAELGGALKDAVSRPLEELSGTPDGVQVGPAVGHPKGGRFQLGSGEVTVTDVLQGKQQADLNSGHFVLAPLALAQNVTGRQGQLDSILITTKSGADLSAVRASVTAAVNSRAIVAPPSMRAARAGDGVKMMNYMALMGAVVALVVGAFLIYTTMTMAITQRRPVISMLRAIGGRRATIVRDMLAEAAILGVIGGAIGAGIGILLGRTAIGRLPPAVTQGLEARVEYWLPGYAIPAAMSATVLTSVVASAMAARQVYKVSPIEALAPAGVSAADRVPRWLRIACGFGAVVVFTVSILIVLGRTGTIAVAAMSALFCAQIALGFALTVPIVKATAATARMFGVCRGTRGRDDRAFASASLGHGDDRTHRRRDHRHDHRNERRHDPLGAWHLLAGRGCGRVGERRLPDKYPTNALPQGLSEKVAAVPGVAHLAEGAFAFADVGGTRVMLDGFSPGTRDALYHALDEQVRNDVLAGRGVVLTQNLGKTLDVRVGDELQLQTPLGPRRTTVLALVPYFSTVIGTVGMDLDQMREWFDRPAATTLQITAGAGVDPNRLLADVRRTVPAPTTYTTVARHWQASRRRCVRACSSPTPYGSLWCSWPRSHFSTR